MTPNVQSNDTPLILLVNADLASLQLMRSELLAHSRIMTAPDLRGASRALNARPDVLVCTENLPDGNGWTFLQDQFRRRTVRAGVLMAEDACHFDGIDPSITDGGALRVLDKTCNMEELLQVVRQISQAAAAGIANSAPQDARRLDAAVDEFTSGLSRCWHLAGRVVVGLALTFLGLMVLGLMILAIVYVIRTVVGAEAFENTALQNWL